MRATMVDSQLLSTADTQGIGPSGPRVRIEPGRTIGRYVVGEEIGAGGMGTVYRAHDPELHRAVALKLLHFDGADAGAKVRDRLMREAQALALLSHPNVVPVFDVGAMPDGLFLAMELVDGATARVWGHAPRSWREVIAMYVGAGEGLAAAHRAGLVHRDFKPENVVVGGDGRPRVLDFGLARAASDGREGADGSASDEAPGDGRSSPLLASPLTRAGDLVGTPPYMAPEQFEGGVATAASDQYSFCVALYEALTGRLPIRGADEAHLRDRVLHGPGADPAPLAHLPRHVRRAILRGLSRAPASRFASMDALLAELRRETLRPERAAAIGAGVVALVAVLVVSVARREASRNVQCRGAAAPADAAWSATRRARVQEAFERTGAPFATAAFQAVARTLDGYVAEWSRTSTEACEATRLRGTQSEELLDLRTACLDGRLEQVRAFADLFEHADAKVVERAVGAVASLPPIASCNDAEALRGLPRAPTEADARAHADHARVDLARARALILGGKFADGLGAAEVSLAEARASGFAPAIAESLATDGDALEKLGRFAEAEEVLWSATSQAITARDDGRLVDSLVLLAHVQGVRLRKFAEARHVASLAESALARVPREAARRATILYTLSTTDRHAGDLEAARKEAERAIAILEESNDADSASRTLLLANAYETLGSVRITTADDEGALAAYRKSRDLRQAALGPNHPFVAVATANIANTVSNLGDQAEALSLYESALAVFRSAFGEEHRYVADTLQNLAHVQDALGEPAKAVALARAALRTLQAMDGPNGGTQGDSLRLIASLSIALGDVAAADEAAARAMALDREHLGEEHPDFARDLALRATLDARAGRAIAAQRAFARSIALLEKALGPSHPDVAELLLAAGEASLASSPRTAIAPLARALAIYEQHVGRDPRATANATWALARARLLTQKDDPEGRVLLNRAAAAYDRLGTAGRKSRAEVDAWATARGLVVAP